MSNNFSYTTIDRILGNLERDLRDTQIHETDAIEWIGQALDFLRVPSMQEQVVAFLKVENFQTPLPKNLQYILQVAKYKYDNNNFVNSCAESLEELPEADPNLIPVPLNNEGEPATDYELAYYRPYYDLIWEYSPYVSSNFYESNFTPVRLSNNVFFNSIVCKEKKSIPYTNCIDEYSIVGTAEKFLRFSFQSGLVAVAFLRSAIDKETGYPLVPDDILYTTAITYYVKMKIAEWYSWNGREGFKSIAEDTERKWLKYARQAKNAAKMMKTLDEFQNNLEATHTLIPNHNKYYGYFGNLGRADRTHFKR